MIGIFPGPGGSFACFFFFFVSKKKDAMEVKNRMKRIGLIISVATMKRSLGAAYIN